MSPAKPLPFDPISEAARQWDERGWGEASAGMAMVTSVVRAQQILVARVDDVLAPFGLTFSRFELLRLLSFSSRGSLPLGKIGARLQVHPASVTNAVDRLERDGLVVRRPHPSDGRATLAEITSDGRGLVEAATTRLNAEVFSATGLSQEELGELFVLLRRVREAAGDFLD